MGPKLKALRPVQPKPPGMKLKPFFWTKLPPQLVRSTFWVDLPNATVDLKDLESDFAVVGKNHDKTTRAISDVRAGKKPGFTTLLGVTRANNIGLSKLGRIHSSFPLSSIKQRSCYRESEWVILQSATLS